MSIRALLLVVPLLTAASPLSLLPHALKQKPAQSRRDEPFDQTLQRLQTAGSVLSERQRHALLDANRYYLDLYLNVASRKDAGAVLDRVLAWQQLLLGRPLSAVDRESEALLGRLRSTRTALAALSLKPVRSGQEKQRLEELRELAERKERLEAELAQATRDRPARRLTAEEAANALPERTARVDFLIFMRPLPTAGKQERRLLAFVLVKGKKAALFDLGAMDAIDSAAVAWRRSLLAEKVDAASAAMLRARLWQPLEKALAGMTTVLISPDGVLGQIPFAALPGRKPGTYLIEEVAIGFTAHPGQARSRGKGLLILANLDYGKPADGGAWTARPGTREEARGITAAFRAAYPADPILSLRGEDGTKAELLKELRRRELPRFVHLATRGYFRPEVRSPRNQLPLLQIGLALAGANRSSESGILTGEEVVNLDLHAVELAVLSADETALGMLARAQPPLSMARAFHGAGAQNVLACLWGAGNETAKVLMVHFYEQLWGKKLSKLQALRQAQLFVLKNPDKVRPKATASPPLWWAGWVLSGPP
jgi:CHAT domain-containing protein